jgi:hypothetical protein
VSSMTSASSTIWPACPSPQCVVSLGDFAWPSHYIIFTIAYTYFSTPIVVIIITVIGT